MPTKHLFILIAIFVAAMLPVSVRAQKPVRFIVRATASLTVHFAPGADQRVVGYLEPGMFAYVFACAQDCAWLEIGPNVWIEASGVVTADANAATSNVSAPSPTTTSVPPHAPSATPAASSQPTVLPSPTPDPTATSAPTTEALTAAEQEYVDYLLDVIESYSLAFTTISEQAAAAEDDPMLIVDDNWRFAMTAALGLILVTSEGVQARVAPVRFAAAHAELVTAADHYTSAAHQMAAGIEALDSARLMSGLSSVVAGNEAIERAAALYAAAAPQGNG